MKRIPALLFISALTSGLVSAQTKPDPNSGSSLFWQASLTAETNKDYDTALTQVTAYQAAGGNAFLANLRLAWLSYLKHDYTNAAKYYNEAERLQPSSINPLLGLMNVSEAQGDATGIEKAADNVLHVDPLNYQAQMVKAAQNYTAKNYAMALGIYHRILTYYPDDMTALGQMKEATADFQILTGINASDPWSQKGLALCLGKTTE